jgi:hypothetical protein
LRDAARHVFNAFGITDRGATVFLDDEGHTDRIQNLEFRIQNDAWMHI